MKFSELWLRSHVNPQLDSDALGDLLTMAGLEVEASEPVAGAFSGVVVARVREVAAHPDADRLRVCQVDSGSGDVLQIVCGAPNVHEGALVPCALVGAVLPGGMEIRAARLRGVSSAGMLCSGRELGLENSPEGLLLLPDDAPPGMDIREYLRLDDRLFTLKLTPNRADCLGMRGLAREVAALTGSPLHWPAPDAVAAVGQPTMAIRVEAAQACPLYCIQELTGIDPTAPTPVWMRERLERSGLRSLGAVVDVTNYVLLEYGQPLHAFDADRLRGPIAVRLARPGEQLVLLNGQNVELQPDMLVIADAQGPQALAGIMGGAASAVSDTTTRVVLEAAFFDPDAIAGRARSLGFSTDASHRFERGVDFAAVREALQRATGLLLSICGGQAAPVAEVSHALPERKPIRLRSARVARLLGIHIDDGQIEAYLQRLGFTLRPEMDGFEVVPPSFRFDQALEVDLIEELARLHGYDRIEAQVPQAPSRMLQFSETRRTENKLRDILVARDYREVVTYSFVDAAVEAELAPDLKPVMLLNPIASQMGVMRSTLMGGLLDVLQENLNRKQDRVRIMEFGRCFIATDGGYHQPVRVGGLAFGSAVAEQWGQAARAVDFYDMKGDLEAMVHPRELRFEAAAHPALHPRQSARVLIDGQPVGWIGSLHPAIVQRRQLSMAPMLFELEIGPLLAASVPRAEPLSRFQPVRRDLAVLIDQHVEAQAVCDALLAAGIPVVKEVALFDQYRGKHIDSDKKSLAFRVVLQDNHKTLTDEEVDEAMAQLTALLQRHFGAGLRS